MLRLALFLLCAAALIGAGLAVLYVKGPQAKPPPAVIPIIHAILGAASLLAVVLAVRRGAPATGMGTAGFGATAATLLGLALGFGLRLAYLTWRRRRASEVLVGTHAGLAIAGLVLVLTLVALR